MDKVIEEVAKGNFERGEAFDFYKKTATTTIKPRRAARGKNRDELSPKIDMTCMTGADGHPLHIDPSGMATMPMHGLISPINIAVSMGMMPGMASPIVVQPNMPPVSTAAQARNLSDVAMSTSALQTSVASAMVSPSTHGPSKPGENCHLSFYVYWKLLASVNRMMIRFYTPCNYILLQLCRKLL
jgi:hypothetical protein